MSEAAHSSLVGGSSADRRINCPGSYQLEQKLPATTKNESSSYADEGTALHAAMQHILVNNIVDIDEVIQLIRSSDDAATAKARLMSVFDLSDAQATYILDLQLRRLTKFSRIELEKERDELERLIEQLRAILADERLLRRTVSTELDEVAKAQAALRLEQLEQMILEQFGLAPADLVAEYGPDVALPPTELEMAEYEQAKERGEQVTAPAPMPAYSP